MGKRVDYSARSVITGDPGLSIKQLGVPIKIAMNLTKPVTVNDMNRDFLAMLIKNGPDTFRVLKYWNAETALISR
jgi:DNA-directed RNA polymerase II subunit RPB1